MSSEFWATPEFRQSMVQKLDGYIQQVEMPDMKSATDMENHIYLKAQSKEEYVAYVAKLLMYIKSKI